MPSRRLHLARWCALGAAALGLLSGGVVLREPTRAAMPPVTLAATTVFEASEPAKALVTLETDATITIDGVFRSAQVEIQGAGRVSGFVLLRDEPQPVDEFVEALVVLRVGACWAEACQPESPYLPREFVFASGFERMEQSQAGSTYLIPARTYRVYAVTDGVAVRATLNFDELRGRTSVPVTAPSPLAKLQTIESVGLSPEQAPYHSGGGAARIDNGPTLLFYSEGYYARPHLHAEEGTCYYLDSTPPADTYLPGCPGAPYQHFGGFSGTTLGGMYSWPYGVVIASMPGEWNFGRYRAQIAGENRYRLTQLWMDLGA